MTQQKPSSPPAGPVSWSELIASYRDQRDRLVDTLKRQAGDFLQVEPPDQGMHLVVNLNAGLSDMAVAAAALEHNVVVRPLSRLYVRAKARQGLLAGFSGYPIPSVGPAVGWLAKAIHNLAMNASHMR